ncbi:MAG: hypothetical protein H6577_08530 [Lewinellaceae bacterium]|nr:hypothetical protein [Saprospiraceae bacterium]MCB9338162.1 hypothetical protein [Lewinellaceae bacterium]
MKYVFLFALALIFACKNNNTSQPSDAGSTEQNDLPEGFAEFYQHFHSDSTFQMGHIVFPLEGLPNKADSTLLASGKFYWKAEDWKMQKAIDFEMSEFRRELLPLNKMMVEEHIIHKNGQYGMVRRFARLGDEWQLIYYAGMNRIALH